MTASQGSALVIGLGCRRGCPASLLLELIESSLGEYGLEIRAITALASIDLKNSEPGLWALAEHLGLPLVLLKADQLLPYQAQLTHRSALAHARTGCHGVAESAALALASQLGGGPAHLLIERRKSAQATFAMARSTALGR